MNCEHCAALSTARDKAEHFYFEAVQMLVTNMTASRREFDGLHSAANEAWRGIVSTRNAVNAHLQTHREPKGRALANSSAG